MALIYLIGLLALTALGYVYGRSCGLALGAKEQLHSRPVYQGAFVALMIFLPMFAVFAIGMPVAQKITESRALAAYNSADQASDLERSAAMRDIRALVEGRYTGDAKENLKKAAEVYSSVGSWSGNLILIFGFVLGLIGLLLGFEPALAQVPCSQSCRARHQSLALCMRHRGRAHDRGNRAVRPIRDRSDFLKRFPSSNSCSACNGAHKPHCEPIRAARRAPSASCR